MMKSKMTKIKRRW